jgi:hypothetical protein
MAHAAHPYQTYSVMDAINVTGVQNLSMAGLFPVCHGAVVQHLATCVMHENHNMRSMLQVPCLMPCTPDP